MSLDFSHIEDLPFLIIESQNIFFFLYKLGRDSWKPKMELSFPSAASISRICIIRPMSCEKSHNKRAI